MVPSRVALEQDGAKTDKGFGPILFKWSRAGWLLNRMRQIPIGGDVCGILSRVALEQDELNYDEGRHICGPQLNGPITG